MYKRRSPWTVFHPLLSSPRRSLLVASVPAGFCPLLHGLFNRPRSPPQIFRACIRGASFSAAARTHARFGKKADCEARGVRGRRTKSVGFSVKVGLVASWKACLDRPSPRIYRRTRVARQREQILLVVVSRATRSPDAEKCRWSLTGHDEVRRAVSIFNRGPWTSPFPG